MCDPDDEATAVSRGNVTTPTRSFCRMLSLSLGRLLAGLCTDLLRWETLLIDVQPAITHG